MERKLKVGVIGVGHLGKEHARVYSRLPGVKLVGVADILKERAREVAERCGTKPFFDASHLLSAGVEAVSVVVPTQSHFLVAKEVLESGIHVLVEKPITRTITEANGLINLAHKKGLVLQVGHIERFNGVIRTVEGLIKNPLFIESHRLSPFSERGTDVAVVLELMIHDIDIILSFVKSRVARIGAVGVGVLSSNEDIANARIEFQNGCIANVTASRVSKEKLRKIRFFQNDAYISLDYLNQEVEVYRKRKGLEGESIVREKLVVDREEPLVAELRSFVDSVRKRKRPLVTGEEGREALRVALMIVEEIRVHSRKWRFPNA